MPVVWAPVFSAVGVLFVGIFAAAIAFRQWRTAHTKLQLDLYQRRYPVFQAAHAVIHAANAPPPFLREAWQALAIYRAEAEFIFDDKVKAFLDEVQSNAWQAIHKLEAGLGSPTINIETKDAQAAQEKLFMMEDRLVPTFRPYLVLDERRNRVKPREAS